MNRLNKKGKSIQKNSSSSIHSGHYMTSSLHDQNEDTVEMPIASPDATNNDVTLNVDQENENIIVPPPNESQSTSSNALSSGGLSAPSIMKNKSTSSTKLNEDLSVDDDKLMNSDTVPNRSTADTHSNMYTSTGKVNYTRNGFTTRIEVGGIRKTISIVTDDGSISGGLTLYDKSNKSLKNLIYYIKAAYSNNLTSPKWKNFKGLKLQVIEKIRLNNVIWRGWFEQYGIRDGSKRPIIKRQQQLICQFTNAFEDAPPASNKMSAREGKFWKARLESITNEYKKWREISRKQIKNNNDLSSIISTEVVKADSEVLTIPSINLAVKKIPQFNSSTTSSATTLVDDSKAAATSSTISSFDNNSVTIGNTSGIYAYSSNQQSVLPSPVTNNATAPTTYINVFDPSALSNEDSYYSGNNINNVSSINNTTAVAVTSSSEFNSYVTNSSSFSSGAGNIVATNNNASYFIGNNNQGSITNIAYNNVNYNQPNQQMYSGVNGIQINAQAPQNSTTTSSTVVYNKQAPYNNRYPSPSPGLFQDIDLYNFSSDTLFSTYLAEDPKDNMFGTNPDFFQPDLMHLYPNFDFFDLYDPNEFKTESEAATVLKPSMNSQAINSQQSSDQPIVNSGFNNQTGNKPNTTSSNASKNSYLNSNKLKQIANKQPSLTIQPESLSSSMQADPLLAHNQSVVSIEYIDLSNFNTLATVAAAQSSQSHPNDANPEIDMNMSKKQAAVKDNIIDNHDSLKMPASLSQINSSINRNASQNSMGLVGLVSENSSKDSNNAAGQSSNNTIRNLLALNTPLMSSMQINQQSNQKQANVNAVSTSVNSNTKKVSEKHANIPELINQHLEANRPSSGAINSQQKQLISSSSLKKALQTLVTSSQDTSIQLEPIQSKNMEQEKAPENQIKSFESNKIVSKVDRNNKPNGGGKRGRKSSSLTPTIDSVMSSNDEDTKYDEEANTNPRKNKKTSNNLSDQSKTSNQAPLPYLTATSNNKTKTKSVEKLFDSTNELNSEIKNSIESEGVNVSMKSNDSSNSCSASRAISRSNSMNSLNETNNLMSLTNAEQKRRCNIQHGFDRLQILVPSLRDKNAKVSKAVMLQKTSDYIKELQKAKDQRVADLNLYKREIEDLSNKITDCQNQLPASGVSVTGNLNRMEKFEQKFNNYVKEKTLENWKFYLFSIFLKPLFDNFVSNVNTSSKENIERTFYEWQDRHCSLAQLRPIASNALRFLSRSTSILTDSSKLPEESYKAILTKI